MAAITRGTPNFALPATQNTAPVHEFRCLYTHDLHKKAKKWHDGSARFHTFNKRVMVYDDTKNYIGDLHYRADEEFGEGIELRLDRGVFVEVGERVGETHTDLTGIVNRPHTDSGSPANTAAPARPRPVQRINAAGIQTRPKSLTELLASSQGRFGRARLPTQSPYERRQTGTISNHEEHPSKRQRVISGKENEHPAGLTLHSPQTAARASVVQQDAAAPQNLSRQIQPQRIAPPTTMRPRTDGGIVNISSDEEIPIPIAQVHSSNRHQKTHKPSGTTRSEQQLPRQKLSAGAVATAGPRSDKHGTTTPTAQGQERGTEVSSDLASAVADSTNASTSSNLRPGMSSLKMKLQQPRRKLMYEALLPSDATKSSNKERLAPTQRQGVTNADPANLPPSRTVQPKNNVELDELFALDDLEDAGSQAVPDLSLEAPQTPKRTTQVLEQGDSPLFVSQPLSQRSLPTPHAHAYHDLGIPATQILAGQSNSPEHEDTNQGMDTDENDDFPGPESPAFPPPPSHFKTAMPTTMSPRPLAALAVAPVVDEPVLAGPIQRSLSMTESLSQPDSRFPHDQRMSPPRIPAPPPAPAKSPTRDPVDSLSNQPTRLLPSVDPVRSPSPQKSSIQGSKSDTNAIVPCAVAGSETALPDSEQGPWTSIEAFLLFDKWPQCKQKNKPVYDRIVESEGEEEDTSTGQNVVGFAPASRLMQPATITSARHVLRDEYR